MKNTINSLKLKKGDKVTIMDEWNGMNRATIEFFVVDWTILATGKKQTYLTCDNGNSKMSLHSDHARWITTKFDLEIAKAECLKCVDENIKIIENIIKTYTNETGYTMAMTQKLNNLRVAPIFILFMEKGINQHDYTEISRVSVER